MAVYTNNYGRTVNKMKPLESILRHEPILAKVKPFSGVYYKIDYGSPFGYTLAYEYCSIDNLRYSGKIIFRNTLFIGIQYSLLMCIGAFLYWLFLRK